MRKVSWWVGVVSTHRWLKRLRQTPNSMWTTPRIMDIFILKEFRKVSLLVAMFQILAEKGNNLMFGVCLVKNRRFRRPNIRRADI